jgi:hypothetical protein
MASGAGGSIAASKPKRASVKGHHGEPADPMDGAAMAAFVTAQPRLRPIDEARQRIVQRRARHQKRMMRVIAILLVALIVILTIVNGSKIAALFGGA